MSELIYDLPREKYDAMTERVNWSTLKYLAKSPAHYKVALNGTPDTPFRKLGRVRHVLILEPEKLAESVAVFDGAKTAKKAWAEFQAANVGKDCITLEELEECQAIADAIRRHDIAMQYLEGARCEVTALWRHEVSGFEAVPGYAVDCRARIDIVSPMGLVDIKTTRDASPSASGFFRDSYNYKHHTQSAFYSDGYAAAGKVEPLPSVVIAAETFAPYCVQVYDVPEMLVETGRMEYRGLLSRLALCRREGKWPGYSTGKLSLELPRWAYNAEGDL